MCQLEVPVLKVLQSCFEVGGIKKARLQLHDCKARFQNHIGVNNLKKKILTFSMVIGYIA